MNAATAKKLAWASGMNAASAKKFLRGSGMNRPYDVVLSSRARAPSTGQSVRHTGEEGRSVTHVGN